jgi:hypothetical protein
MLLIILIINPMINGVNGMIQISQQIIVINNNIPMIDVVNNNNLQKIYHKNLIVIMNKQMITIELNNHQNPVQTVRNNY